MTVCSHSYYWHTHTPHPDVNLATERRKDSDSNAKQSETRRPRDRDRDRDRDFTRRRQGSFDSGRHEKSRFVRLFIIVRNVFGNGWLLASPISGGALDIASPIYGAPADCMYTNIFEGCSGEHSPRACALA